VVAQQNSPGAQSAGSLQSSFAWRPMHLPGPSWHAWLSPKQQYLSQVPAFPHGSMSLTLPPEDEDAATDEAATLDEASAVDVVADSVEDEPTLPLGVAPPAPPNTTAPVLSPPPRRRRRRRRSSCSRARDRA
jgi:hypothetical protein